MKPLSLLLGCSFLLGACEYPVINLRPQDGGAPSSCDIDVGSTFASADEDAGIFTCEAGQTCVKTENGEWGCFKDAFVYCNFITGIEREVGLDNLSYPPSERTVACPAAWVCRLVAGEGGFSCQPPRRK